MKIFVDTGSIKDIQTIADLGILDGVLFHGLPGDHDNDGQGHAAQGSASGEDLPLVLAVQVLRLLDEGGGLAILGRGVIHAHTSTGPILTCQVITRDRPTSAAVVSVSSLSAPQSRSRIAVPTGSPDHRGP